VPFETISRLQSVLEEVYGPRAGRGIALRSGRACFHYGLRDFGPLTGLTDLAFRLLPLPAKLNLGSRSFAELFNKYSDQHVQLEQDGERIFWNIDRCPVCWERRSNDPVCHLAVGVLQEALYWASGGRFFNVEETRCIARGDPCCSIMIDKTPLN
jgi:predicted hydrocarbon binding protein